MILPQPPSHIQHGSGRFKLIANLPGRAMPGHGDHGWGPLARFDESIMEPGGIIPMHEHRNDEIVSYVSHGVMRHSDSSGANFAIDPSRLMVMGAGRSFWHEEKTDISEGTARWLQIFVRPTRADLEPGVQIVDLPPMQAGSWRLLAGPEGAAAPAVIRNAVWLYDIHLEAGMDIEAPAKLGFDLYLHCYRGAVAVNGVQLGLAEGALVTDEAPVRVLAEDASIVVAFLIDRTAPVTHAGTIGR